MALFWALSSKSRAHTIMIRVSYEFSSFRSGGGEAPGGTTESRSPRAAL